jgi:hypothetical protein
MSYRITPSQDNSHILIEVRGVIGKTNAMQQNIEAHRLGRSLGIKRYLVDLTQARNRDSVLANYEFAYHDMRQCEEIDLFAKVVLLVSPEDHSHDFIETVSKNAGFNVTLFTDSAAARRFLLGEA